MKAKPVILWLADLPGWAYESIVRNVERQLPQYEHRTYYVCKPGMPVDGILLGDEMKSARSISQCLTTTAELAHRRAKQKSSSSTPSRETKNPYYRRFPYSPSSKNL